MKKILLTTCLFLLLLFLCACTKSVIIYNESSYTVRVSACPPKDSTQTDDAPEPKDFVFLNAGDSIDSYDFGAYQKTLPLAIDASPIGITWFDTNDAKSVVGSVTVIPQESLFIYNGYNEYSIGKAH